MGIVDFLLDLFCMIWKIFGLGFCEVCWTLEERDRGVVG